MTPQASTLGTCALCLTPNCQLQRSHFFPAAAYKHLREPTTKNPNPVWTGIKGAVQTSYQVQDYLLCFKCEQRLRSGGEDWVMQNCWHRDGAFPLQARLRAATPDAQTPRTDFFCASKIREINVKTLSYFAGSIFWRASVHHWRTGGSAASLYGSLGPYEEAFRQYLLGCASFPEHTVLQVGIAKTTQGAASCGLVFPVHGPRLPTCLSYKF